MTRKRRKISNKWNDFKNFIVKTNNEVIINSMLVTSSLLLNILKSKLKNITRRKIKCKIWVKPWISRICWYAVGFQLLHNIVIIFKPIAQFKIKEITLKYLRKSGNCHVKIIEKMISTRYFLCLLAGKLLKK